VQGTLENWKKKLKQRQQTDKNNFNAPFMVIHVLNIDFFNQLTWPPVKVIFLVSSLLSVLERVLTTPWMLEMIRYRYSFLQKPIFPISIDCNHAYFIIFVIQGDTPKNLCQQFYKKDCIDYLNAVGESICFQNSNA